MALGFYYDEKACIGCRTCQVACKDRNRLDVGMLFRHVLTFETGTYPDVHIFHWAATCNHCESPQCVENCPTGAMYIEDDGTVQHDDELCIGCKQCVNSCPYGNPVYNEAMKIVQKCDSCKPLRDVGENPVCVDACNMRALKFGDFDELSKEYGPDLVRDLPILPDSKITDPHVLIHPRTCALSTGYRIKQV